MSDGLTINPLMVPELNMNLKSKQVVQRLPANKEPDNARIINMALILVLCHTVSHQ